MSVGTQQKATKGTKVLRSVADLRAAKIASKLPNEAVQAFVRTFNSYRPSVASASSVVKNQGAA